MENIDSSKVAVSILSQQTSEADINHYKSFFKENLINVKNREVVLSKIFNLILRFQKLSPKTPFLTDPEKEQLDLEAKNFLKNCFPKEVLDLYNKPILVEPRKQNPAKQDDKPWASIMAAAAVMFDVEREKSKKEIIYKTTFLNFLFNCLLDFGLHPEILKRNPIAFKRYNVMLEHDFKTGNKKSLELKILIKKDVLLREYISPYENKLPIKINGRLILFENIIKINISSTLLLDNEIDLFMLQNNLTWTKEFNNQLAFANICMDESDELINNPYLIEFEKKTLLSSNLYFVSPDRIKELLRLKSKNFDLTRLIQLCEELNNASLAHNLISPSLIARAIIDHIPPIFELKNFSEIANNYSGATKSFKKSMLNLENSLRNIADGNIHTQIRNKEVLPTRAQIDFTQDLDLLLSEIVRILK
jgi:hypothetical protein